MLKLQFSIDYKFAKKIPALLQQRILVRRSYQVVVLTTITRISALNGPIPPCQSSRSYGPDGPWPAVSVRIGGLDNDTDPFIQAAAVDLFPGGRYASHILTPMLCDAWPGTACAAGVLWTPFEDQFSSQITFTSSISSKSGGYALMGRNYRQLTMQGRGQASTIYNTSLVAVQEGNITYPNGLIGPPVLGYLNVGAKRETNVTFPLSNAISEGSITSFLYPAGLWRTQVTPSYSYGLHLGSVAISYQGSLIYGGFDSGRILGDYVTYSLDNPADIDNTIQAGPRLLDVVLGVEKGGTPFDGFVNRSRLLLDESSNEGIYNPAGTRAKIASYSPVSFGTNTQFYLWDTEDPAYERIVKSPGYLGFVFASGGGSLSTVTIKVPFAPLNLTLSAPITPQTTQYFPCVPRSPTSDDASGDLYRLGRAFLQAAYIGANWNRAIGCLGQAPGPGNGGQGLGPGAKDIQDSDTILQGVANDDTLFARSWADHWTELPINGSKPGSDSMGSQPPSNGISTGAKAGFGAGCGAVALTLIACTTVFVWRRQKGANTQSAQVQNFFGHESLSPYVDRKYLLQGPSELDGEPAAPCELRSSMSPIELPGYPSEVKPNAALVSLIPLVRNKSEHKSPATPQKELHGRGHDMHF
ncbi:hypothetical protein BDZ85DRAFT_296165 [Elsinoe ampelina]|uniref:Aspartic peptidase domain-containing protein n=1 Tax=Elsinoe ampelina TaxID=302913 RepID=A0A6A6GB24_9PEZI|nr:hypothetical protein BDZ85DRAFT_296165 [Elsinoe ampelina]